MEILNFFIPTEILRQIFAMYLSTKDVSRFDTAICNKAKRPIFLILISSRGCPFAGYFNKSPCSDNKRPIFVNEIKYITWLNRRGLSVNHLTSSVSSWERADKIDGFGTSLISLQLRVSTFKESRTISKPSFIQIMRSCTGLTSLNLERFRLSNATILVIIECCTLIKNLEVCGNSSLTDASMLTLAEGCPKLESLTFLQPLDVPPSHDLLLHLVNSCPRLTSLNLSHNKLTDATLCTITQSCIRLLNFDISNNKSLKDSSLFSIASSRKQLKTLDISSNDCFTDASLIAVADSCTQLQSLNVSYCCELTSVSIIHIGELQNINLKNEQVDRYW